MSEQKLTLKKIQQLVFKVTTFLSFLFFYFYCYFVLFLPKKRKNSSTIQVTEVPVKKNIEIWWRNRSTQGHSTRLPTLQLTSLQSPQLLPH